MAYTIAQYKNFVDPGISPVVIDEIRRNSYLIDNLPFTDNGVVMANRWVYGYDRKESLRSANTRLINTEYTPDTIDAPQRYTTDLSIMGGSFTIDRVMGRNAQFLADNFTDLTTATIQKFHDLTINGDANNAGEFDGLDVALAGSTTEYNVDGVIDLSDITNIDANMKRFRFEFGKFLRLLNGKPDALLVNEAFFPLFSYMVSEWGAYTRTTDDFGTEFDGYNGTTFIDVGTKPDSNDPIIPIEDRVVDGNAETGLTDIYAVRFGPQQFHGVSPDERGTLVKAYEPSFDRPGAVHLGEVEIVATVALEETKAAGVFRNIKVQ